jgi:hypothetical protein
MGEMGEMTRADHVKWCKTRALEYVDQDDCAGAVTSMVSDLGKHEDTKDTAGMFAMLGMFEVAKGPAAVRNWIDGF